MQPVKLVCGADCNNATSVQTAPGGLGVAVVVVEEQFVKARDEVVVIVVTVLKGEEETAMIVEEGKSFPAVPLMMDTPMNDFSDSCDSLH